MQIRAGVNLSTVTGGEYNFHPGFYAGIQKDLALSKERITFQPGIYYSLQTTQSDDFRVAFHYLQVPAMFNFKFQKSGGILFGPQLGMLLHSTSKALDGGDRIPITPQLNVIALSLGGGPYIKVSERCKLEFRINVDVLNVDRTSGANMISLQGGLAWLLSKAESE
jgi:hypothetical protein